MNEQFNNRMPVFKKVFTLLLVLDLVGLILAGITLVPNFPQWAEYGQIMLVVSSVMVVVMVAVALFEILAKGYLIRNASQESINKRCVTFARALVVFNLCAVIINLLAMGGEGATLLNQTRIAAQVLASAAEVAVAFLYLRTVKGLFAAK